MSIRVSYIVATRNRKAFLPEALATWKQLKGPDDELIIVDGMSDDGSYELLRDAEPGLIDRLVHEPDQSEAHALNKGLLLARGDLIKPLTDDDLFFRDGLEKAYETMFAQPEIDILNTGGEYREIDASGSHSVKGYQQIAQKRDRHWHLRQCGVGLVIRRSALALTGLFDTRHFLVDTSYLLQAYQRGARIAFLQVKTFQYHYHANSGIVRTRKDYHKMASRVFSEHQASLVCRLRSLYPRVWRCIRSIKEPRWGLKSMAATIDHWRHGMPPAVEPQWNGCLYD